MLGFGGIMQGFTLENPDVQVTMATVAQVMVSFHIATTMCLSLVSIGNGIFAFPPWLDVPGMGPYPRPRQSTGGGTGG